MPPLARLCAEEREKQAEEREQILAGRREQKGVGRSRALRDAFRASWSRLQIPQNGFDVLPLWTGKPRRQPFFFPIVPTASAVVSRACSRASRL